MRRLAVLAISVIAYAVSRIQRGATRLLGRIPRGTCVVLYYHAIRPEHRSRFASQLDSLLRHALPVRADRTEPLAQGVHHAVVTFDDGFENVVHNALPELSKRQIPSAIFIITESLGKYPHWLTESYGSAAADRVMSEEQLKGLPAELVVVGSHTLTHPALPRVNEGAARRELSESRVRLEKLLARDIKLFSFPYGALNADLITWCREAGYRRVFSISPKLAFSDPDQFVTGRVSADPTDWPIEFYLKLMGAYCWLPAAFSLKRRLFGLLRRPAPKSFAAAGVES